MATTERSTSTGPAAEANVKRVHIKLLGVGVALNKASNELAEVVRPAPTDVFVQDKRPFHFAGQPGALHAHPQVHRDHPETILHLRVGKDSAVWWSETEFHIDDQITLATGHPHPAPAADAQSRANPPAAYPFSRPVRSEAIKDGDGNVLFWQARSTVPVDGARGHFYKISFTIDGQTIDPDMFCGGG